MRPHPFNNVYDLFSQYGIIRRDAKEWRLVVPTEGQIYGLDNTHGTLLATNGMLCFIWRAQEPETLFEGHLDYFVAWKPKYDAPPRTVKIKDSEETVPIGGKVKKTELLTQELIDLCI